MREFLCQQTEKRPELSILSRFYVCSPGLVTRRMANEWPGNVVCEPSTVGSPS